MTRRAAASEWADLPNHEVDGFIASIQASGWNRALDEYATRAPFFVQRLRNTAIGNWHALLTRPAASRTLDVGCGFGALPAGMSECYECAIGMEMLPERLRVASLRMGQGLLALVRGNGHALPFGAGALQLITMNGVLEWAAHHVEGGPAALQLGMLREARRVLGSGGAIGVAIENRFALETLLGMRDTHTGLHLVPALPRLVANRWSRVRRGTDYRTYLYSRTGYVALFRKAGFSTPRILDLVPSYNDYDFIVEPTDAATYRFLWSRNWVRSFARWTGSVRARLALRQPRWLGSLSYAYLVLGIDQPTLLEPSHPLWEQFAGQGLDVGAARFAATTNRPGVLTVVTHKDERIVGVLRLARERAAGPAWQDLRSMPLRAHLEGSLVRLGEIAYQDWWAEGHRVLPQP
jgi:SAM-dependent methyltransferase